MLTSILTIFGIPFRFLTERVKIIINIYSKYIIKKNNFVAFLQSKETPLDLYHTVLTSFYLAFNFHLWLFLRMRRSMRKCECVYMREKEEIKEKKSFEQHGHDSSLSQNILTSLV